MGQPKLTQSQRESIIVTAGLEVARKSGLASLNFIAIEKHTEQQTGVLNTSRHVVKHWFEKRDNLWDAVIKADNTGELAKQAEMMGYVVD